MTLTTRIAFAASLLVGSSLALGQSFEHEPLTVTIRHKDSIPVTLTPHRKNPLGWHSLKENRAVKLPAGWYAKICVEESNPILFIYKAGDIEKSPTESYLAMQKLAEAVKTFVAQADAARGNQAASPLARAGGEVGQVLVIEGIDVSKLRSLAERVASNYQRITGWIKDSYGSEDGRKAMQAATAAAARDAKDLAAMLEELTVLTLKMTSGAKLRVQIGSDRSPPIDAAASPSAWIGIDNVWAGYDPASRKVLGEQRAFLDFARQERTQLREIASTLSAFASVAAGVSVPPCLDLKSVEFDPKNKQKLPIAITANDKFKAFFDAEITAYQQKLLAPDVYITFVPEEKIQLRVAPGVLYSFVKNPEFSAVTSEAGVISIQQKTEDYNAVDGVVALNLTWNKYAGEGTAPYLQIGLVPSSDSTAFVLGAGLNFYKEMVVSAGVIYQRVRKLDGQSVGDVLESADDLKTKREFKTGFYIGLGVGF
jgi:hypothetical protein